MDRMDSAGQEIVRAFRRQAQDVRRALEALEEQPSGRRMVNGYIEVERWLERYRRLCVPIRRTFLDHDKASFRKSAAILCRLDDEALRSAAAEASREYEAVMAQLGRETVLGGRRVAGTEILKAWLDAAVFYDSTDTRRQYDDMLATYGKAAEGLAADYTSDLARAVLSLDATAAAALGEPLRLPDPEPARAPPSERGALRNWWSKLGGWRSGR